MTIKQLCGLFPLLLCAILPAFAAVPAGYTGKPFGGAPLSIPGKFLADRADSGAINVTYYHPGNGKYTDMLKMTGIDLYFDCVLPGYQSDAVIAAGEKYWAYIEPNEWMKATINVAAAGQYAINMLVTNGIQENVRMLLAVYDGADSVRADTLKIPYIGTCGAYDFHSWYVGRNLDTITLNAGVQVLKVQTISNGPFNVRWTELQSLSTTARQPVSRRDMQEFRFDKVNFSNKSLSVTFTTLSTAPMRAELYDLQGRLLATCAIKSGGNSFVIPGNYAEGLYILRMSRAGITFEAIPLLKK